MSRYHAAFTMFVFLKRRAVLEYYFGIEDAFRAANDSPPPAGAAILSLPRPYRGGGRSSPRPPPRPELRRRTDP
jgi:hypothetical protein